MAVKVVPIEEHVIAGKRLGRYVRHDDASFDYPAAEAAQLTTAAHLRHAAAFDQGNLGSCTGNAMAGILMTEPFYHGATRRMDEANARLFYSLATRIDSYRGTWPPDDPGSDGLSVMKAAQFTGFIRGYRHAFSLDSALRALVIAPEIIGINWYDSMDEPNSHGVIEISPNAVVRGGHELMLHAIDVTTRMVAGYNSWGPEWGELHGQFLMSFDTLERLLAEDGDVTIPVV